MNCVFTPPKWVPCLDLRHISKLWIDKAWCSHYFHQCHFELVQFQEKMEPNVIWNPSQPAQMWKKQPGETERLMGEVKVHRMYLKVVCMQWFTWLWSSPQFCTRNREGVQKGQRGKRSLAKLESKGRTNARNQLKGQRKLLKTRSHC